MNEPATKFHFTESERSGGEFSSKGKVLVMAIKPPRGDAHEGRGLCGVEEPIGRLRLLVSRSGRCLGGNEPGKEAYAERLNISKNSGNGVQGNGGDQLRMFQQIVKPRA